MTEADSDGTRQGALLIRNDPTAVADDRRVQPPLAGGDAAITEVTVGPTAPGDNTPLPPESGYAYASS